MRRTFIPGDWIVVKEPQSGRERLWKADITEQFSGPFMRHATSRDLSKLKVKGTNAGIDPDVHGVPFLSSRITIITDEFGIPSMDHQIGTSKQPEYYAMELHEDDDGLHAFAFFNSKTVIRGNHHIVHVASHLEDMISVLLDASRSSDKKVAAISADLLRKMYIL